MCSQIEDGLCDCWDQYAESVAYDQWLAVADDPYWFNTLYTDDYDPTARFYTDLTPAYQRWLEHYTEIIPDVAQAMEYLGDLDDLD
jgi:hypothetical protein